MADKYDYLVSAANDMYQLLGHCEPEITELITAADIGCRTLTRLVFDHSFYEDLTRMAWTQREYWFEVGEIYDLGHFEQFLQREAVLLIEAGMSPKLVEDILQNVLQVIREIRENRLDPHRLHQLITILRNDACRIVDELREDRQQDEEQKEERGKKVRRRLRRIMYAISGSAIVVINAGSAAVAFGLTAPAVVISSAVGGGLIGASIPND